MAAGNERREFLKLGLGGVALGAAAAVTLNAKEAAAQAASDSLLRTVLDRGHLIVGTGSTNAPWHFENDAGELVGMDITMGRIIAKALFDDPTKVEFVKQDAQQRIPNIVTGKVDITLQFMTISGTRAQLINFTRPYYVEGVALLTKPSAAAKTFDELKAKGSGTRIAILQNVDAETTVHAVLPDAQVMQIDTQANVFQALDSNRADASAVDLSNVRWLVAKNPDRYFDAGKQWNAMLYGGGVRQSDIDWLTFVNTAFSIAMFGHDNALYDAGFKEYFGMEPPERKPGFPSV
ncbi:transporter substrate-binding domain-containing protein [Phyllobacterium sp. 0TCS1.6C]|uniref:transporter substrate-binding domain-containing protein n=1 Tax=unclassified Phyllobacterium TaxID=2638441 RepID=UPI00226569DD|nr:MULTISPECIES: transporter substrate-binding domain-containing protein [unclassified Phyllobacterium]MCX8279219.1 transporter substrate-binding domain-containing protein [Phyllobacterium sp. 0TCS1.6C]MCX8294003.1 transporter substrate-binding domain-containing protein [Phyllobacterium sp. 0TCS1.6A]